MPIGYLHTPRSYICMYKNSRFDQCATPVGCCNPYSNNNIQWYDDDAGYNIYYQVDIQVLYIGTYAVAITIILYAPIIWILNSLYSL